MAWSGLSRLYLVVALLLGGGTVYLWLSGQELFTEEREQADAESAEEVAAGHVDQHHRHRYGFGVYGYRGGK